MLSNVCRLCLATKSQMKFENIFSVTNNIAGKDLKFADAIMECAPVEIDAEDALPKLICPQCVNILRICYEFRETCVNSDNTLRLELEMKGDIKNEINEDSYNEITTDIESKAVINTKVKVENSCDDESATKGLFVCDICNKQFHSNSKLTNHHKTHSSERPFLCNICGKRFKQKVHLVGHDRTHRKKVADKKTNLVDDHQCPICLKVFKKTYYLTEHMNSVHCDESTCMCEICGSTFKKATKLRIHLSQSHQVGKLHACTVCAKTFGTKAQLSIHNLSHTDELPYKCELCDKCFKYRVAHWRHMKQHTGERPHKCTVCEKAFIEAIGLRRHMRVHTGERPRQCHICYRSFKERAHLTTHIKLKHKNE